MRRSESFSLQSLQHPIRLIQLPFQYSILNTFVLPSLAVTMQLTTVLLSLFAVAASAAPTNGSCTAPTRKFGIMALRSASPIHFATAGATQNKLVLNIPEDKLDAQCADGKARRDAI